MSRHKGTDAFLGPGALLRRFASGNREPQ